MINNGELEVALKNNASAEDLIENIIGQLEELDCVADVMGMLEIAEKVESQIKNQRGKLLSLLSTKKAG